MSKEKSLSKTKHIAFIGTGPISLLKAYLIAKENPNIKITILDSNPNFGGAWYSDKSPKGHEIESGCHIWSYSPEVYNFFRDEFGLELEAMNPSPVFVGKYMKLPYSLKNSIDTYKYIFKTLIKGKKPKTKGHPALHARIVGKKNKYPKMGSVELINALRFKIDQIPSIKIVSNFRIVEVNLKETVQLVGTSSIIECDKIYLTSVSEIKKIKRNDSEITLEQEQVDYIHFLLELSEPARKKMKYWRLMNDPVIHRISDISYQTHHEENLLLVGIKPEAFNSMTEEQLLKHCTSSFLDYKLIGKTTHVQKIKTYIYPTFYIKDPLRKQINELAPDQIELIHSTDLIHGFYYILNKSGLA